MKSPSLIQVLQYENYVLKNKCDEMSKTILLLQNQMNGIKDSHSITHNNHVNTVQFLQNKNTSLNKKMMEINKNPMSIMKPTYSSMNSSFTNSP